MYVCVYIHVYVPPLRLLITSGMMWIPCDWLNKFYSFYMAAIDGVVIVSMALAMKCIIETNLIRVS